MSKKRILFISTGEPEHASEELWSRTAVELAKRDYSVVVTVPGWPLTHVRAQKLTAAGAALHSRPKGYSLQQRGWHYLFSRRRPKILLEIEKILRLGLPDLVVFSEGFTFPPIEVIELCISKNLPFVTISNGNYEALWPTDEEAARYRVALSSARRCYFVSVANVKLTEKQIGCALPNAEVVWSQYNVDFNYAPAWPISVPNDELLLACVGRLYPPHKAQDILLEALASPIWADRRWRLCFYGDGPMRNSIERLTTRLGLSSRVSFGGHRGVEEIWAANQVLVMPSRNEGGPLTSIEAMLCGRPVLGTNVGRHPEIIIDGVTGFLIEAATVPSLLQGLEKLWENRENLEDIGKAAAKTIREFVPPDPIEVFSRKMQDLL